MMHPMEDIFAGTWTLITGASSGLGEEFARQLAARRSNLLLTARSKDKLAALAGELARAHGVRAEAIALDLAAPGGAARLCEEVGRRGHDVTHLVSNAGFGSHGPFIEGPPERLAEMVRLNCEALTVLSAHFLPRLVARRAGGVLHVASVAANQPTPYMATYAASKAFVLSLSAALSEELRGTGVRCLALCPGPVQTGFQAVAGADIAPGQRRAILSAAETVRRGLDAYVEGRAVFTPGALNRAGALGAKLLPRGLVVPAVGRLMRARASLR